MFGATFDLRVCLWFLGVLFCCVVLLFKWFILIVFVSASFFGFLAVTISWVIWLYGLLVYLLTVWRFVVLVAGSVLICVCLCCAVCLFVAGVELFCICLIR